MKIFFQHVEKKTPLIDLNYAIHRQLVAPSTIVYPLIEHLHDSFSRSKFVWSKFITFLAHVMKPVNHFRAAALTNLVRLQ